ncbi:MAG: HYR domain-containing protein, partial [Bacteroidota bacterium]
MRFLMIPCYLGLLFLSQTLSAKSSITPPEISLNNLVHVSCFGLKDGAISVSVSNGAPPYSFVWSNGEATPDIKDLAAGVYTCTVTDQNGAQAILADITVKEPPVLQAFVDSIHNIDCIYNVGYLRIKASGGVLPYSYLWNNGSTGASNNQLPEGTYTVTVTDGNGCSAATNGTIIKDTNAPLANAGPDVNIFCSNSMTTLSGSGSSGPNYQYLWTTSNGGMIQSGGTTLSPVISRTGTYTLKVTNLINGCNTTDAAVVTSTYIAPNTTATGGIITCAQPTVTLHSSYTTSNTIFNGWGGPGGYFSTQHNPTVSATGSYYFSVLDTITTCSSQATTVVTSDLLKPTALATGGGTLTCIVTSLTLQGSGTPLNISFAWSGPGGYSSAQQNPVVTGAGVYTLTVTNPGNGCTASASQSVLNNTTAPTSTVTVSNVITCLAPAAMINCNTSPAGCTFNWSGPGNYSSTQQSPTVLNPGVYTAIIRNPANGCTSTASATVLANNAGPVVTTTGGALSCAVTSTMISASSNVSNASYTWTGPNFFSNVRNPTVTLTGTYTVTATNPGNGCSTSATAFVSLNSTQPNVSATGALVNCNTPNPKIIASSTTQGATFLWNGPNNFSSNIPNPNVTAGGTYTVTATNPANGCTRSTSIYVTEDLTPPFVYAGDDRSLNCYFTSIVTNPIGIPTGPNYSYLWTTSDGNIVSGATTINARLDLAGTYTFKVKNASNGCSAIDSMVLRQSPPVTATITQQSPISCNGGSNAVLKITPGGGNENYTYTWSTGAQTTTISNVGAGTYTVAVIDGEGCSATGSFNVAQPPVVQAVVNTTPQTMQGANNGSATVIPSGGTPGYTVKWNNNSTLLNIANLAPGNYTVTVTDSKGCTFAKTGTVNAVNCTITGSIAPTNLNCAGVNNGAATLSVSGAANPTTYLWSNGATTSTISNLPSGNYSVTATDAQGCPLVLSTQISSPQPLSLAVSNQTDVACNNAQTGSATLSVSGGTAPFTYKWSNNQNSATASNLGLGAFTCTVTDSKSCTLSKSVTIVATDHNAPQLSLKNASVSLNANGTATVTPAMFDQGSTDLECSIVSWTVNPTTFDCSQIGTRTVTITATDLNGNTATGTATVQVSDDIAPTLVCPTNKSATGCAPVVTFNAPQIQDNCSATGTPVLSTGLPSGSSFPVGVTNQMFTYTDAGGNSATCTFTVTVTPSISLTATGNATTC